MDVRSVQRHNLHNNSKGYQKHLCPCFSRNNLHPTPIPNLSDILQPTKSYKLYYTLFSLIFTSPTNTSPFKVTHHRKSASRLACNATVALRFARQKNVTLADATCSSWFSIPAPLLASFRLPNPWTSSLCRGWWNGSVAFGGLQFVVVGRFFDKAIFFFHFSFCDEQNERIHIFIFAERKHPIYFGFRTQTIPFDRPLPWEIVRWGYLVQKQFDHIVAAKYQRLRDFDHLDQHFEYIIHCYG